MKFRMDDFDVLICDASRSCCGVEQCPNMEVAARVAQTSLLVHVKHVRRVFVPSTRSGVLVCTPDLTDSSI